jgi:hypothetical protein
VVGYAAMSAATHMARRVLAGPTAVAGQLGHLEALLTEGRPATWGPAGALLVGAVPFAAFASLVLYHFYIKGAFFWDSGLLSYLLSAADPSLPTPPVFGGGSFFATHFTPVFVVLSLGSPVLAMPCPGSRRSGCFMPGFASGRRSALPSRRWSVWLSASTVWRWRSRGTRISRC